MGKLDRYIARHVLAAMLLVLLVLGGLDIVFTLIDELGDSEGGYGMLAAFKYVLYTAPRHVYELLSPTALIGSLAGLGSLAAANELVGMQAAGYSRWQLTRAVMQPAILVMLLGVVLGEYLAPQLELQHAAKASACRPTAIGSAMDRASCISTPSKLRGCCTALPCSSSMICNGCRSIWWLSRRSMWVPLAVASLSGN